MTLIIQINMKNYKKNCKELNKIKLRESVNEQVWLD